jgi:F420-dependent oxidoreductase-like protein
MVRPALGSALLADPRLRLDHGQPWGRPYWRIRDYVSIMRKIFEREETVSHEGREISLPYRGEGAMGIGKPLKSILHMNPRIPIWLGTGSESNVRLTAEIADGWFPLAFVPGMMDLYRPWLEDGFRRAGGEKGFDDFEIQPMVAAIITDHVGQAFARMKPGIALYAGGMGHRNKNFHNDMMVRRGYPEAAEKIQELYLAGRKREAIEAVPDEYCDEASLVGPPRRIRDRYKDWEGSGATGLILSSKQPESLELMAELTGSRDRAA